MSRKLKPLEPWIIKFIGDRDLVVMRDKRTRKPLAVSYTEDGLTWTANKYAKLIYYKNAYLSGKTVNGVWIPTPRGDLRKNPNIIVEKYIPENHKNPRNQVAEYLWCNKG